MKTETLNSRRQNGNHVLSSAQLKTFKKFQRGLNERVPDYHIAWVRPYSKTIIEIGLKPQNKMTYRKTLRASQVATDVEDETGITIVLL